MKHIAQKRKGFTLIEIMIAIAIVGILASAVMVSMKTFRAKARSSKALAMYSAAIPSMIACWGNGYGVNHPFWASPELYTLGIPGACQGGCDPASICSNASYGVWPKMGYGDLSTYTSSMDVGEYYLDNVNHDSSKWFFWVKSSDDNVKICCNSKMSGCGIVGGASASCDLNKTW